MTDLAELYLLFLLLYLFECLAWVPRRAVGFFTWAGRWRARPAFRPNDGWSWGVVLGKPWPPLAPPWFAESLPFALDPVAGMTPLESEARTVSWEAMGPVRARGHRIEAAELSLAMASGNAAAGLAAMLESMRSLPAKKRESELRRFLDRRYASDLPRDRRRQFARSVRGLRILSNALWLALFGGLGVAVLSRNMLVLLVAAALSLVLWPANAIAFALSLRTLAWLPAGRKPDAAKRWVAFLSPISGARAVDLIAREMWADLEPLAVAAELLSSAELTTFARPLLVGFQARPDDSLAWWRAEHRQRIERLLLAKRIRTDEVLGAPVRESERVRRYCPACHAQFAGADEERRYCPGERCVEVELRAFPTEKTS